MNSDVKNPLGTERKNKSNEANASKIKGKKKSSALRGVIVSAPSALREVVFSAPAQLIDKYVDGYDPVVLAKLFGDEEMMRTAKSFFDNDLNVSKTAGAIYMHRNTLMYRLNKIKKLTGLDVKTFNDAVSFQILSISYALKWRSNGKKQQ